MVRVTGHKLKECLKLLELNRAALENEFSGSLVVFKDEQRRSPLEVVRDIEQLEHKVAKIQTAQAWYNCQVQVKINEKDRTETITLAEAVKRIGGLGRAEKRWKVLCKDEDRHHRIRSRSENEEIAQPVLTTGDVLEQARTATRRAAVYRAAIAAGNSELLQIDFLEEDLLKE